MVQRLTLHADRLFPADPGLRDIARRIFASARDLPILSPHGHTDPAWFATNSAWQDATSLLLVLREWGLLKHHAIGDPHVAVRVDRRADRGRRSRRR